MLRAGCTDPSGKRFAPSAALDPECEFANLTVWSVGFRGMYRSWRYPGSLPGS